MSTSAELLPDALLDQVLDLVRRAPSIRNTQPWWWRVTSAASLELHADDDRRLPHADRHGRQATISCGCALHHLEVAARGLGWSPLVRRAPADQPGDLLAHVDLLPGTRDPADVAVLEALGERRSDRRRFTTWPVPAERLEPLLDQVASFGVVPEVLPASDRVRLAALAYRAARVTESDRLVAAEHRAWPEGGGEEPDFHLSDAVVVLTTRDDDRRAWLCAGEALDALWIGAVREGLSLLPLATMVEVPETRDALRHELLQGRGWPQVVVRITWQQIGRDPLPRTGRRPVTELLRPS